MSDLYSYQYAAWNTDDVMDGQQMQMPVGCQLSDWLLHGKCMFQFDGLKSLLGQDVTLRMQLYKCADSSTNLWNGMFDSDSELVRFSV
jgi:hypothetical protein